jgi:probable rRNA maturation factor
MARIKFFSESVNFKISHPQKTSRWIKHVIHTEGLASGEINIIFCSDEYLRAINVEYLDHDTYTDIITFDNSEESGTVDGDIFISIDRVNENAIKLTTAFEDELHRVIIHGILHLLGYNDKNPGERAQMRQKEDACLSLR